MLITRYSCHILMKLEFLDRFSKNTWISNFFKIRAVGSRVPHGRRDGEIDTTQLTVA